MGKSKLEKKTQKAIKKLQEMLEKDNINIEVSDPGSTGKSKKGDLTLTFKKRKYPISVSRKGTLPYESLESEKEDSDILFFRKDRKKWRIYMDLNTLIMLLLNRRS